MNSVRLKSSIDKLFLKHSMINLYCRPNNIVLPHPYVLKFVNMIFQSISEMTTVKLKDFPRLRNTPHNIKKLTTKIYILLEEQFHLQQIREKF